MIDIANIANRRPRGAHLKDPYPWLEPDDPRCSLTDEQILDKTIDLSASCQKVNGPVETPQESI